MTLYPAASYEKAPGARLAYAIDYSQDGPMPAGETIASATATADNGITVYTSLFSGLVHTIWLEGGTDGQTYNVVSAIVTSGGQKDERTIQIVVRKT